MHVADNRIIPVVVINRADRAWGAGGGAGGGRHPDRRGDVPHRGGARGHPTHERQRGAAGGCRHRAERGQVDQASTPARSSSSAPGFSAAVVPARPAPRPAGLPRRGHPVGDHGRLDLGLTTLKFFPALTAGPPPQGPGARSRRCGSSPPAGAWQPAPPPLPNVARSAAPGWSRPALSTPATWTPSDVYAPRPQPRSPRSERRPDMGTLTLRPADDCRYQAVSLGEVMLRLDRARAAHPHRPLSSPPGRAAASTRHPRPLPRVRPAHRGGHRARRRRGRPPRRRLHPRRRRRQPLDPLGEERRRRPHRPQRPELHRTRLRRPRRQGRLRPRPHRDLPAAPGPGRLRPPLRRAGGPLAPHRRHLRRSLRAIRRHRAGRGEGRQEPAAVSYDLNSAPASGDHRRPGPRQGRGWPTSTCVGNEEDFTAPSASRSGVDGLATASRASRPCGGRRAPTWPSATLRPSLRLHQRLGRCWSADTGRHHRGPGSSTGSAVGLLRLGLRSPGGSTCVDRRRPRALP